MTTEDKIIEAAENEMLELGFDAARMRSIAEKAEINKGLLHYYFKSKEALLTRVFQKTFNEIFKTLNKVFESDKPFFEKIEMAVDQYSNFLIRHPRLPMFIISEMNRDPAKHKARMKKAGVNPPFGSLLKELEAGKKKGLVRKDLKPEHVMLNMIGLIMFPIIAKPMVMFMNDLSLTDYKQLLHDRKKIVSEILINDIKAK
jgi:TetR/AcrR family transcriptional regulator